MPTIAGDGVQDVWTLGCLEGDFEAHEVIESPLVITLNENGEGDFTATIVAEQAVSGAKICMAATLDEYVPANGGGMSHLPYHVVHMMTATTGDAFSSAAGETTVINKTFIVEPGWDYADMGVACWVQAPGGVSTSPCTYPDLPIKNRVLQSAFIEAGSTGIGGEGHVASLSLAPASPNPFRGASNLSFAILRAGHVTVSIYDLAGRKVAEVMNERVSAGEHHTTWDGADGSGETCGSGVFFARVTLDGGEPAQQKLVRLK